MIFLSQAIRLFQIRHLVSILMILFRLALRISTQVCSHFIFSQVFFIGNLRNSLDCRKIWGRQRQLPSFLCIFLTNQLCPSKHCEGYMPCIANQSELKCIPFSINRQCLLMIRLILFYANNNNYEILIKLDQVIQKDFV
ncbi:hypothetical protein TTHERM_000711929 (macronuclear) [Tetrahymena thermophila SB210]|uniref:Uncharacterized protein n=1 Tax=Tetrahymena thermophila (strain SB210) TaxID=312017 RepID=W7XFC2_TETTS|nr:hypothetical protein TTHERM_000711929 [Tetrahymena thermophila SB210]EWS71479.1 hypothetical protein TTHERM_000711929 [Tetrahymena thermophila SB210]|eukprot:XP_012655982.1 hypothetical protein TTHERM_000711929 [Tetrahymena thermophila SB210]